MELFSEVYNCYYRIVNQILRESSEAPVTRKRMEQICQELGFAETALTVVPKLTSGQWDFLFEEEGGFYSKVDNLKVQPFTVLQKSWLKSLLEDRRIRLFLNHEQRDILHLYLADVPPLYRQEDFLIFDRYSDGDPYNSLTYQEHFRQIMEAVKERRFLQIAFRSGKGRDILRTYLPCRLEYSSKDDKFRLQGIYIKNSGRRKLESVNLSRITHMIPLGLYEGEPVDYSAFLQKSRCREPVRLEISTERNALERTMLHFAAYEKHTEKCPETGKYLCSIYYNKTVETELLIQVLSFGPVVRVLGPESFLRQVRERVRRQAAILEPPNTPPLVIAE